MVHVGIIDDCCHARHSPPQQLLSPVPRTLPPSKSRPKAVRATGSGFNAQGIAGPRITS